MQIVIVNADDLGMNHQVNKAIEALIKEGVVTSSTIMSNGDSFDEAVEIAKTYSNISYGVHLCIDEFSPLIPNVIYSKNGMVNDKGFFIPYSYLYVKRNKELENAIYEEWKAQIKKIIDCGVPINHLDTHHHVHCEPFLTPIYMRLANEFGIKKVRITLFSPLKIKIKGKRTLVRLNTISNNVEQKKKSRINQLLTSIKTYVKLYHINNRIKKKFETTDYFCSFRFFLSNQNLLKRYDTIEVMVHPGHTSYQQETDQLHKLKFMNDVVLRNY